MSGTKVALAGATGNLGPSILNALLDAGFSVVVLTRKGGNASKIPSNPNIAVKEVDYSSVESLIPALQGVEAVVSTVGSEALGAQTPLIDAAVAAGVKRFLPSEFGSNLDNANTAALPVFGAKVATAKYLEEVAAKNPSFSYTRVYNGAFLDWCMAVGFIIQPKDHSAKLFNGGDRPFSATTLATIGKATAAIIKNQAQTKNRAVYIQDVSTTQKKLIAYAKEKDGKDFATTPVDTETTRQEGLKALSSGKAPENIGAIMVSFIFSAIFQEGFGGEWSAQNDNELLGLPGLSEPELKKLVQSFL
ncbi:uncharacterized protein A1O9_05746 [Exophiala aquamarina CBS 119918]|uniref:NmrA-like domain-containing protein n=1 Tax=Exophiala aquamarina CBS 119918 TaxID=1182545 RepID=A0A072PDB1_9EURO|nr:uncharacterized protein A1O9_05746 [Exophiala aquamarina CBS 119918]KEF57826.1 hypothetical protein A1O9_05746 [Exophiala aquamarina CBS 119918]